jgi:hypothetical protein
MVLLPACGPFRSLAHSKSQVEGEIMGNSTSVLCWGIQEALVVVLVWLENGSEIGLESLFLLP